MKTKIILLSVILLTASHTFAYNFKVGDLCYNINSDGKSVTVTYENSSGTSYTNIPINLSIPAKLTYEGKNYSVTSIGDDAFYGCGGLTSITIPNSVTSIGNSAFGYCSGLTSVSIPNSVTSIGNYAFDGCTGLTSVVWNVKNCNDISYSTYAPFIGLTNIKSFEFGNAVEKIPAYLCYGLTGLTSITIPNSVTSIGNSAFGYCSGLTSVTIGNSVTSIGNYAFDGCAGLTSVVWNVKNYNDISYSTYAPFIGLTNIKSFEFGNAVEKIPAYLCYGLTGLTSITIPNSVTSIGNYTFDGCSGLTSITIPNSVTSIGKSAFEDCSGLTSVTIGNSVTSIGNYAFDGCTGLTSVVWNVKNCNNFSYSYAPFNGLTGIKSFKFGSEVEKIPAYLCYGLTGLTSITIPNSVTSIGDYTFDGCSGLTSITIPNSVTSIGNYTFDGCSGLTSITIPNSVTSIGNYTFDGCSGLTSITIPNSVISIGNYAFDGCTGLTSVVWNAKNCNDISYSTYTPFIGLTNIKSFEFGNAVEKIPAYLCYGLTGLTSITIPNSVTSIGDDTFYGCSSLISIISLNSTPPSISSSTFSNYSKTLYVKTPDAYKNADYWKYFGSNIKILLEYYNVQIESGYTAIFFTHKSTTKDIQLHSVKVNNKTFNPNNDESILVNGLQPNSNYTLTATYTVVGEQTKQTAVFNVSTKNIIFSSIDYSSSQTTAQLSFKVARDRWLVINNFYVKLNGSNYPASIVETTDEFYTLKCNITGLNIATSYTCYPSIAINGVEYSTEMKFNTKWADISVTKDISPTTALIKAEQNCGDAKYLKAYFIYKNKKYDKLYLTGLKPSTTYSVSYVIETESGTQTSNVNFWTTSLKMTAQAAKMLDNRTPLLLAETNLVDEEVSCGFEWRRYDAPAEMPSTQVYCPVYNGIMSGTIRNMTENVYYKYRPFYKASDGTMYYGDWIAFITADAGIYFEPLVHTYADFLLDLDAGNATIKGVAIRGSETISEQGFEYWWSTTTANAPQLAPSAVNKVKATGERITTTLSNLQPGCTYSYRSYVVDSSGTFYGETRSFNVPKPAVSGDLNGDGNVNAGDVSELYSAILRGASDATYDLNGDGNINAGDISSLYSIILRQ